VRGNYVLCSTNAAGYPWEEIKASPENPPIHIHAETDWEQEGLLPYTTMREVLTEYAKQFEKEHSGMEMEMGGSSSSDSGDVDFVELDRNYGREVISTRFNFIYNGETGGIESPDTVWEQFDRGLRKNEMKELSPEQLEVIFQYCGSYASADDFYQGLKGCSLHIVLPDGIRSVPNKASKTTESGRIWQVQDGLKPNGQPDYANTTLEKVLGEIKPSEQVDT
jgi:hypothetical protein